MVNTFQKLTHKKNYYEKITLMDYLTEDESRAIQFDIGIASHNIGEPLCLIPISWVKHFMGEESHFRGNTSDLLDYRLHTLKRGYSFFIYHMFCLIVFPLIYSISIESKK